MCPTLPQAPHLSFKSGLSFVFLLDFGGERLVLFEVDGVVGVGGAVKNQHKKLTVLVFSKFSTYFHWD